MLDVATDDSLSILGNYIHGALKTGDGPVMGLAAKVLGHLAQNPSVIATESVEFEMKSAMEWLQTEKQSRKVAVSFEKKKMNSETNFLNLKP